MLRPLIAATTTAAVACAPSGPSLAVDSSAEADSLRAWARTLRDAMLPEDGYARPLTD